MIRLPKVWVKRETRAKPNERKDRTKTGQVVELVARMYE